MCPFFLILVKGDHPFNLDIIKNNWIPESEEKLLLEFGIGTENIVEANRKSKNRFSGDTPG